MSEHSAEKDARCPNDGQSLAWHLVTERGPNDEPRTNADFIGCRWSAELEHEGDPMPDAESDAGARRDWSRRLRLAWCALSGHATKCLRCGS